MPAEPLLAAFRYLSAPRVKTRPLLTVQPNSWPFIGILSGKYDWQYLRGHDGQGCAPCEDIFSQKVKAWSGKMLSSDATGAAVERAKRLEEPLVKRFTK
jgi:hypothetical protein